MKDTKYFQSPLLYKENGFKKKEDAEKLIEELNAGGMDARVLFVTNKQEKKAPPLLYNLAELQNDCSTLLR